MSSHQRGGTPQRFVAVAGLVACQSEAARLTISEDVNRQASEMMKSTRLLACLSVAVMGCSATAPARPRSERQPAYIRFFAEPSFIDTPDAVNAATPFTVTVRTFGGGCIDQGDTQSSIVGSTVEVRPFDIFATNLPSNYACPDILRYYAHSVSIRLDQRGSATIRVIGRVAPGDTITTFERAIVVR